MHPINLLAPAIKRLPDCPLLPCKTERNICAITGLESECISRKFLLKKTFTNLDALKNPNSKYVSEEAYIVLKYRPERSAWFSDGVKFERLTRIMIRDKVFIEKLPSKWSAYATTSYKKHGVFTAIVNVGKKRIWAFEMRKVDCSNKEKVDKIWERLLEAKKKGIGHKLMATLMPSAYMIGIIGLANWIKFEKWARPLYQSSLYSFLCYLLPSQQELKDAKKEIKNDE